MKKSIKVLLIISLVLVLLGSLFILIGYNKFDFNDFNGNNKMITKEYEINEIINDIDIDVSTTNINIYKSNENKIICKETEKLYHDIKIGDNTLSIKLIDNRETKDYLYMNFVTSKFEINLYLNEESYDNLNIDLSTGDIDIEEGLLFKELNIKVTTGNVDVRCNVSDDIVIKGSTGNIKVSNINGKSLDLSTSTGKVEVNNVKVNDTLKIKTTTGRCKLKYVECMDLLIEGTTGKTDLNNVIASDSIHITKSTGDVEFVYIDSEYIKIKTTTGDVKGSVWTPKSFYANTKSGKVSLPKTIGDICEVETTTGDIEITIK